MKTKKVNPKRSRARKIASQKAKRDSCGRFCSRSNARVRTAKNPAKVRAAKRRQTKSPSLRDPKTGRLISAKPKTDKQILTELLRHKLREVPDYLPTGILIVNGVVNTDRLTWAKIIAKHMIYLAATSKNIRCLQEVLNRTEGKPFDRVKVGIEDVDSNVLNLIKKMIVQNIKGK